MAGRGEITSRGLGDQPIDRPLPTRGSGPTNTTLPPAGEVATTHPATECNITANTYRWTYLSGPRGADINNLKTIACAILSRPWPITSPRYRKGAPKFGKETESTSTWFLSFNSGKKSGKSDGWSNPFSLTLVPPKIGNEISFWTISLIPETGISFWSDTNAILHQSVVSPWYIRSGSKSQTT